MAKIYLPTPENGFRAANKVNMSVIAQVGVKGRQLYKFGGSSLADAVLPRVAGIMAEYSA